MSSQLFTYESLNENLLSVEQARHVLLNRVSRVAETSQTALLGSLGQVLAADVTSLIDVPGFDNSAMDGYAIAVERNHAVPIRYRITQRVPAGTIGTTLKPGCAARIFTGAPVPPGANAVVMQEEVQVSDGYIEIARTIQPGENIRPRGNDIGSDDIVLSAGQRLGPQHIALAASVGVDSLQVYKKLRVGVFFTGDELVQPGTPLQAGQIYNSNRYAMTALLANHGCEVQDLGNIPDSLDETCKALELLAGDCDLVMTTGGVSVGEEDHVKSAVEKLGSLSLWRIAMKPGKPLAFGTVGESPFIGLPGNPVSAFVTFILFARPLILKMQGISDVFPHTMQVRAGFDWPRCKWRREFVRVRVDTSGTEAIASLFPKQGSDVLSSMVWADGLVEIKEGQTFSSGEWLTFLPFSGVLT